MVELKNENISVASAGGKGGKAADSVPSAYGEGWGEASFESDLELYFPDQYVPSDSERMLLYRELDGLQTDEQVSAFRTRLIDRFGPLPETAEEDAEAKARRDRNPRRRPISPFRRNPKAADGDAVLLRR